MPQYTGMISANELPPSVARHNRNAVVRPQTKSVNDGLREYHILAEAGIDDEIKGFVCAVILQYNEGYDGLQSVADGAVVHYCATFPLGIRRMECQCPT